MLKPLYACTVAESILTLPSMKKAWSPKIGDKDLELARWSSHLPVRNGTHVVLRTRTQTTMFTRGVARVATVKVLQHGMHCVDRPELKGWAKHLLYTLSGG